MKHLTQIEKRAGKGLESICPQMPREKAYPCIKKATAMMQKRLLWC